MECGYNSLFLFVFHTSSTKLSRRDPLLWTSLTEASSFLKKKRKRKKRHTIGKKYRFFLIQEENWNLELENFFPIHLSPREFFSFSFPFHGAIFIVVNRKRFVVYGVAINGIETNRSTNELVRSNRVVSIVSHHRVWLTHSKPQKHRIQVVTSKTAFRSAVLPLCSPLTRKPLPGDHLDRIVICFPPYKIQTKISSWKITISFTREKIKISIYPFTKWKFIKKPITFNFYCIQFIHRDFYFIRQRQKKF